MFDRLTATSALLIALAAPPLVGCGAPPATTPTATPRAGRAAPATLPDGLVLHARPTPGAGAVTLQLWLPAGAMHVDPPATAPLAALVAERRLTRALGPLGAEVTSWARADAAVLAVTVAAPHLDAALAALAAAVNTTPTDAELTPARARLDALAAAAQRDPDRGALQRLIAEAWGDHPAARPLFGGDDRLTVEAVAGLYAARYRPEGAALIAVGAVEPAALRRAAGDAFAGWTGTTAPVTAAPTPTGGQIFVERAPGGPSRLRLAWPVTVATPADAAALDLLARALVEGPDAPLPAALAGAGLAAEVDAFVHAPTGAGLLVVSVDGPPDAAEALWDATRAGLDAAGRAAPPPGRLTRAVDAVERALDTPRQIGARTLRWPADADGRAYRAALAATPAEVIATRARALTVDAALALVSTAVSTEDEPSALAGRLAERAGATPPLPAGITLDVVPSAEGAGLHLDLPAGLAAVPDPLVGAAHLAAAALSAPVAGVAPTVELGPERLTVRLTVPPERLDEAIATLGERVMRPRWTPATVERARAEARAGRADRAPGPRARALALRQVAAARAVALPADEEIDAGLETLPPARLGGWYDAFVTHAPLRLTVVTDRPTAEIARAVAGAFGPVRRPVEIRAARAPREAAEVEPAEGAAPAEPRAPAPIVRTTTRPDAGMAVAWALPTLDGAGLAAVELAVALLADAAAGEGVVAAGAVRVGPEGGHAVVTIAGAPGPARAALGRLDALSTRLAQVPIEPAQIAAAARKLVGRRAVELDAAGARAAFVAEHARAGRPFVGADARSAWSAAVERTRAVDLLEAAREHLAPTARFEVRVAPVVRATPTPPS